MLLENYRKELVILFEGDTLYAFCLIRYHNACHVTPHHAMLFCTIKRMSFDAWTMSNGELATKIIFRAGLQLTRTISYSLAARGNMNHGRLQPIVVPSAAKT